MKMALLAFLCNFMWKQEGIPVGCVPLAAVAVCCWGVCLSACWDTPPGPGPGPGHVPPKKLSFRFRISLSDMTNYKSADF